MKALKRLANLVLVLCVLTFAQQAYALTVSTYATAQNNWQGSRYYSETTNDGTISCRVDYAVYDTLGSKSTAENTFINSIKSVMPDMSQYLYVYQVFNNLAASGSRPASDASINYFAVFRDPETELNISSQNIGEKDDGAGGIGPSDSDLDNDGTRVVWDFTGGLLLESKHSWYLVLTSDGGPVKGGYEVRSPDSDMGVPDDEPIPEPATIALLSSGVLMIAGRRKRK